MNRHLPESINPARLAKSGVSLNGIWPKERAERILEIVQAVHKDIELQLGFRRTIAERVLIEGHISAELEFICQRCLRPFCHKIDDTVRLVLSSTAEDPVEEDGYEVQQADDDGNIEMQQLIENEVIVRIPNVLAHAQLEDCDPQMLKRSKEFEAKDFENPAENPFDVLKQLK